jgi:hypothetical protein
VRGLECLSLDFTDLDAACSGFSLFVIASITFVASVLAIIIIAVIETLLGTLCDSNSI